MQQNRPSRRNSVLSRSAFQDDAFEEDALRVYASDASQERPVLAMVRPRTVEQVRELMRWAEVERIPIHPRGREPAFRGACPPGRGWLCPCSWIAFD